MDTLEPAIVTKAQRVLLAATKKMTGSTQKKPQGVCRPLGQTPVARYLREAATISPMIRARNPTEAAWMYPSGVCVHMSIELYAA